MRKHNALFVTGIAALLLLRSGAAFGWGSVGHAIVNGAGAKNLPATMSQLASQQAYLVAHASDADNRRVPTDTAEAPKHFIDIDAYPNYLVLTHDLGALTSQYGWATVKARGLLPWAIAWAQDSLTEQFRRHDWAKAYQTASDLGHYVGDAHQPLHCTENYNGALTGNNGIHSRYESGMLNPHQSEIIIPAESVDLVIDPLSAAFDDILYSLSYVDSIMAADNFAKAQSGWNGSNQPPAAYYDALWQRTGDSTRDLLRRAAQRLASLWYTAWVNAGLTAVADAPATTLAPAHVELDQNYPNPFNPSTTVSFSLSSGGAVTLTLYAADGREVTTLVDGFQSAGTHAVRFDGNALASGVYYCRLRADGRVQSKSMLLLR
jgi:hypothetical protein